MNPDDLPVGTPTPAEPVAPATTEPVTPVEPSGQEPAPPVNPPEPGNGEPSDKPPEPQGSEPVSEAEKRIKQLVAKQREAEREAAYWRGVSEGKYPHPNDEPVKQGPNGQEVAPVAPDITQFTDYSDYEVAKDAYLVEKAKYEFRQEQKAIAQARERQTIEGQFTERVQKVAETKPQILDIIKDQTLPINDITADLIRHSEAGPDVVLYLNENREEALKIAQMHPILAAREFGRIEAKLLTPKTVTPTQKISQAPEPITPVGTRGAPSVDLDSISMKEFVERRNREQFGSKR